MNLVTILDYIKANRGKPPESLKSWQSDIFSDQEARTLWMVAKEILKRFRDELSEQLAGAKYSVVIMEGFLL